MAGGEDGIVVVGAGIAGLAAALRLAHAGLPVTVLDSADAPGGKIRTVASEAGPVDAGPTVLTLREVFDALFAEVGERLEDHLALRRLDVLARHFWTDGTRFDLRADPRQSAAEVERAFGAASARAFRAFSERAATLFEAFDAPMMRVAAPSRAGLAARVLARPELLRAMSPHLSLAGRLRRDFAEPKLRQVFGRYATYVGGAPGAVPALLALIWHAEAAGVWRIEGGMHALPRAIEALARARGAVFRYGCPVDRIARQGNGLRIHAGGEVLRTRAVLFNGDPRALATGRLGPDVTGAVPRAAVAPRSLSACVLAFAARAEGPALAHHSVFFDDRPDAEFASIARGELPAGATLYVCAQDHGRDGEGRFEIVMNAPAGLMLSEREKRIWTQRILDRLGAFGLSFDPAPGPEALTTPDLWDRLFPASLGALYGRSPQGLTAAFRRPLARSRVAGLYLAGGGAHPGAGLPMAALSGRHAAAAMLADLPSISPCRRTAMPGGMSTGSATTAPARSASSGS